MSKASDRALLPAGLRDVLPPEAAHEAEIVARLLACVAGHGYERVEPPLIEFEDSLLRGAGADLETDSFRLMDPVSRRMMAVRADITPQIARIATTRLANAPRPLRLSYAGDVLRVKGTQLRPERQFGQVGAELVGAPGTAADAEVILLAVEALTAIGVGPLSVDLGSPMLVPALCAGLDLDGEAGGALRQALDRKDAAAVAAAAGLHGEPFAALLAAAGPADEALAAIGDLDLPPRARAEADLLAEVSARVRGAAPDLALTVDPVENRGFEYHSGVTFTLFAPGGRGELGSGGRYLAGPEGEPATGFSLYLTSVMRAAPAPAPVRLLYLPGGTDPAEAARLRADGWVTVAGLRDGDPEEEARRLGCGHVLRDGKQVALD
jgi:ATP phosphoribosyltransferase regulatory subunit